MILIGPSRSPYARRVAIVLNAYGMDYEQQPLSGFDDRAKVRAFNPLGRIPALTHADVAADLAERFARGGLKVDTARNVPRLHALVQRLRTEDPAFTVVEHPR